MAQGVAAQLAGLAGSSERVVGAHVLSIKLDPFVSGNGRHILAADGVHGRLPAVAVAADGSCMFAGAATPAVCCLALMASLGLPSAILGLIGCLEVRVRVLAQHLQFCSLHSGLEALMQSIHTEC